MSNFLLRRAMQRRTGLWFGAALTAAAVLTVQIGVAVADPPVARVASRGCSTSTPFVSGQGGYASYRIPATITAAGGSVLAFAEGRVGGAGDAGNIDVVLRRSNDAGCTWGAMQVVADQGADTIGNPAPLVDPKSGDVVLLTTFNLGSAAESAILRGQAPPRAVFLQRSSDNGATFTTPREISATTRLTNWRWYATGPGHALAMKEGAHAGRLVVPANHSI